MPIGEPSFDKIILDSEASIAESYGITAEQKEKIDEIIDWDLQKRLFEATIDNIDERKDAYNRFSEMLKGEGDIKISREDFLKFVKEYVDTIEKKTYNQNIN